MLSPRWRKVLRDLWGNKARTVLVVLSIAVGVFAVGMITGTRVVMSREMHASWAAVNPASATLYADLFDEDLIWTVRNMPGVGEADARRSFGVRFKSSPEAEQWRNMTLFAYPDYEDIRIFQLRPEQGAWPPPEHEILIERASLAWMGLQEGDMVIVEAANGKLRELRVAGTVHDMTRQAASWTGWAYGYISANTLEWLGLSRHFDELNFIAAEQPQDVAHIRDVAERLRDKIEKSGRTVYYTWIETPGKHPADNDLEPIMMLLGSLGFLSLLASGFLVVNTLQALLTQQIRQIGIMKAVGARNGQIMGVYYGLVLSFCFLSLTIAVPLGALAAHEFTSFIANLVNFDVTSFGLPPAVLALQAAVGLVVPILAALYPILSGVRVPAREAMSDYGLSNGRFGRGLLDRLLERVRGVSRPIMLSLRNTFRHKGRLVLTLITLTLGGAIFIAVFSVRASLLLTLDDILDYVEYDAYVIFRRGYRVDQIEREALRVPGVVAAEAWRFGNVRRVRPDDTESETILLRAPRADSDLVHPKLVEGRWLLPEDENAVVVNTFLLKDEPDVDVGDEITLKIEGRETTWRVVGIMTRTDPVPMAYVGFDYLAQIVGGVGRAGVLFVQTERHDAAFQAQVERALEQHFEGIGLNVSTTMTSSRSRGQAESQFEVLVIFLLVMAVLLAVVGAIGLMGTMSLNVLERTREIGVMRAIGASDGAILKIVIVEGVLIGLMSWLLGTILALPLSRLLSDAVGVSIFQTPLSYTFSLGGVELWLGMVVLLATLASFWPARNASRVTVRDVLAYE
ncbi:MAG: ABC transporter permease [Anaerolineae bacterium]|jgi:putative ABC transport system permease protein